MRHSIIENRAVAAMIVKSNSEQYLQLLYYVEEKCKHFLCPLEFENCMEKRRIVL